MRWTKRIWTTALLLAASAGCKQQVFISTIDRDNAITQLTERVEKMPDASQQIGSSVSRTPVPATILDPERPARYLSLAEAVSISLEHGTRGQGVTGQAIDDLAQLGGGSPLVSDSIRVLSLDPSGASTTIEASLSKFDAIFQNSMVWNTTDRPITTALDAFQAGRGTAQSAIQTDQATFTSSLLKPLPTGGVAGITFTTVYTNSNLPSPLNPTYAPQLQFQFEQPLLQGFGVEINELRNAHPGSILSPSGFGTTTQNSALAPTQEGILLTRIRFDQSRADFEATVNQMVANVEQAYWNLYGSYWNLYSRELGLRLAYESWRITRDKHLVGGAGGGQGRQGTTLADVDRTRGQYELFRGQRIDALAQILEGERQLRQLLGLPIEDGKRLVPSDTPTLSAYQPDWEMAKGEALRLRPELVVSREELKIKQLNIINQKNFLLPDLRFFATYDMNGLGDRLDGSSAQNAARNLVEDQFNNWQIGLKLTVPLGFRQANALVRQARLDLGHAYLLLDDQERKAVTYLGLQYRNLFRYYEQIRAQRAQRIAYGEQLRLSALQLGDRLTLADQVILDAQRFFADALANEYNAIVQYNNTLALFEYAKGTLLKHNNIQIGEDALPHCVQERAVEHLAKRSAALVVADRPVPLQCTDGSCNPSDLLPKLPQGTPGALPGLLEKMPKLPADDKDMSDLPAPSKTSLDLPVSLAPGLPVPDVATRASTSSASLGTPGRP